MLDLQRYKEGSLRSEVHFTRVALWAHLVVGGVAVVLLLFHEVFRWAAGAGLWYLMTVLLITGILSGMAVCRCLLALFFFIFTIGGILFLGHVLPELKPEQPPLISHSLLPLWLGLVNVTYAAGGIFFLLNVRIRKACDIGFKLW
jgi:hypothetical protein